MMDWQHVPELVTAADASARVERAEKYLRAAVAAARAAGHSWELVGAALGVSRQSAWERFRSVDS